MTNARAPVQRETVSAQVRRTPGLRLDDPGLLAVRSALTRFAYRIGKGCFRTADWLGDVQRALADAGYQLSPLRYDLGKLRGKGLVRRLCGTQRYEVTAEGYRVAVRYQKLYHQWYGPRTAGLLEPVGSARQVLNRGKAKMDRLYEAVDKALQALSEEVGVVA